MLLFLPTMSFGFSLVNKDNLGAKVIKIMEIIVVFLIFLLFYWNIFVILRQLFKIKNNMCTNLQVVVLKHLADGEQHEKAPANLSDALFYAALKSLKAKDMVSASFLAGGEVVSSQITEKGSAALDIFIRKEKKIIRNALNEFDLNHEQLRLLNNARTESLDETSKNHESIMLLNKKGYLKHVFFDCNRHWVITEEGKDVLDEIDERLYDSPLHVESCNEHDYQVESVEQAEKTIGKHDIRIADKHLAHVIEVVYAMCKLGYFEENGKEASIKSVMETIGEALHSEQLSSQYSSHLNRAANNKMETFLQPFNKMLDVAEEYCETLEERKKDK